MDLAFALPLLRVPPWIRSLPRGFRVPGGLMGLTNKQPAGGGGGTAEAGGTERFDIREV